MEIKLLGARQESSRDGVLVAKWPQSRGVHNLKKKKERKKEDALHMFHVYYQFSVT